MSGLSWVVTIWFTLSIQTAVATVPPLSFGYDPKYNETCPVPVQHAWVIEIRNMQNHLQRLWETQSEELFDFLFARVKGNFPEASYHAALSICPSTVSYSRPLVLNVSRFLRSRVGDKANPEHAFIVLAFHELMHNWVEANLHSSAILEKYREESREVRVHLHLMAIEKFVYEGLGREDLRSWIGKKYPEIGGDYARAWEIVQNEGVDSFLREFN